MCLLSLLQQFNHHWGSFINVKPRAGFVLFLKVFQSVQPGEQRVRDNREERECVQSALSLFLSLSPLLLITPAGDREVDGSVYHELPVRFSGQSLVVL